MLRGHLAGADTIVLERTNYEGVYSVWLVGGGLRLFPDGVDTRFQTIGVATLEHGAVGLHLRRR